MAFHSEWLRNNPKGPPGPIPPKGAFGALGSPLGSHLMPLGPNVLVSRDDNVATRVIGGGAGIARAYKQGRRAARSVYGLYFEPESRPAGAFWADQKLILARKSSSRVLLCRQKQSKPNAAESWPREAGHLILRGGDPQGGEHVCSKNSDCSKFESLKHLKLWKSETLKLKAMYCLKVWNAERLKRLKVWKFENRDNQTWYRFKISNCLPNGFKLWIFKLSQVQSVKLS